MRTPALPKRIVGEIEKCVELYTSRREEFANLAQRIERDLVEHAELRPLIHSTKRREKDPKHLRDKLRRKASEALAKNEAFTINRTNLFERIGDLAGVRLLHIHTEQLAVIHPTIMNILNFHKYTFREKPLVYIWDIERQNYLKKLKLDVKIRPTMYTSVHYIVVPHWGGMSCEIQVRTLAEELWGEVSHAVNYPHKTKSIACIEQLAVLARVASGCTRLVDSIFSSKAEHERRSER